MTTVSDIVTDAAYAANVAGQGEVLSDADAQLILRQLKRLMDNLSTDNLLAYNLYYDTFTMTPQLAQYDVATVLSQGRPIDIDSMYVRLNNIDYSVDLIDNQAYNDLAYKITPAIPQACYIDWSAASATLNFYPTPYAPFLCVVNARQAIMPTAITLTSAVVLPPGYERFMVSNLAVEICPFFGQQVDPGLAIIAADAKALLKRQNNAQVLEMDDGLTNRYPDSNSFIYQGF